MEPDPETASSAPIVQAHALRFLRFEDDGEPLLGIEGLDECLSSFEPRVFDILSEAHAAAVVNRLRDLSRERPLAAEYPLIFDGFILVCPTAEELEVVAYLIEAALMPPVSQDPGAAQSRANESLGNMPVLPCRVNSTGCRTGAMNQNKPERSTSKKKRDRGAAKSKRFKGGEGRTPSGGMILLTDEIKLALPSIEAASASPDWRGPSTMLHVRLFAPIGSATWYIAAGSPDTTGLSKFPDDYLCYGCVTLDGEYWEWGLISVKELESINLPCFLHIERDVNFAPRPFGAELADKIFF